MTHLSVDFYFANIKLFWPYDLYKFSEDLALTYLMRKNYDVELALAMIGKYHSICFTRDICLMRPIIVVDLDDLVDMMRRQDD